jgi:hypothetical protein
LYNAPIEAAHPAHQSGAAPHGLNTSRDIVVELGGRNIIEIVIPIVVDEVAHCRTLHSNEFIRNSPHLTKRAVDDFGAQIRAHEQYAVIDRVEHGVEFLVPVAEGLFCLVTAADVTDGTHQPDRSAHLIADGRP